MCPFPVSHRGRKSRRTPLVGIFNFHQVPVLAEELVAGRQVAYFRYFLDPQYVSDTEVARYAESYAGPEHLHAAFEIYRALPANEKFNAEQQSSKCSSD